MTSGASPSHKRFVSLFAVIGSMTGMSMFYGYTGPLLSIVLEDHGVSGVLIGFNGAVQMAGVFLILPFLPGLIRRYGPARLMMVGSVLALAAILAMAAAIDVWIWFPLRLIMGAAQSMMWTTGETWINHASDDSNRGRTVSFFMSAIAAGFASGPFLQAEMGSDGWLPFLVGAAMIALIALPLFAGLSDRIDTEGRPSVRLPQYVRLAPVPMLSNLVFAMVASSLMALLAVYGLRLDMAEDTSSRMVGWMGWGGVFMPLLIGYLADKMDRTLLLAWFVGLGGVAALTLSLIDSMGPWLAPAYLMVFGGLRAGHYGLAVMLVGERFRGADLPSATVVFGFMFGIGSVMGPSLSGLAIDIWDPHGLPVVIAIFYFIFLPLPLIAWWRRRQARR
jgi:MFS family permease